MHVRRGTISDIQTIIENNILLAKESENEILDNLTVKNGVKTLLNTPEKGFYLVAEKNGIVIGQLMITYEWSDWRNVDIWWIQSVYVQKRYRREGVFSALFNKARKLAKNHHIPLLRLYVHKDNTPAQHVYEKRKMIQGTYLLYEISIQNSTK